MDEEKWESLWVMRMVDIEKQSQKELILLPVPQGHETLFLKSDKWDICLSKEHVKELTDFIHFHEMEPDMLDALYAIVKHNSRSGWKFPPKQSWKANDVLD